ncbi:MAG: hypothetical protein FWD16_00130 [Clostridia bacterium]|nr:hypothetical protein [Clostridia bacterium]
MKLRKNHIQKLVLAALLTAVGILIPMFMPVKIVTPIMTFTLASHVCIILAIFIDPIMALAVAGGTTLGFFLGGFPLVVVLRALSHLVFAMAGAMYIKGRKGKIKTVEMIIFAAIVSVIHGICEFLVIYFFFSASYAATWLLALGGGGTFVHSMVDFIIAFVIIKGLAKTKLFPSGSV